MSLSSRYYEGPSLQSSFFPSTNWRIKPELIATGEFLFTFLKERKKQKKKSRASPHKLELPSPRWFSFRQQNQHSLQPNQKFLHFTKLAHTVNRIASFSQTKTSSTQGRKNPNLKRYDVCTHVCECHQKAPTLQFRP